MITIALPDAERRALTRSLWITLSVFTAAPWLAVAVWRQSIAAAAVGLALALLLAVAALAVPGLPWRLYRAWNGRVARPLAAVAAPLVMRLCYLVITTVARGGSRLATRPPGPAVPSAWTSRAVLPADWYRATFAGASRRGAGVGWTAEYVRWSVSTGNGWAIVLLPFVAVLRLLPGDHETDAPQNIYTLF